MISDKTKKYLLLCLITIIFVFLTVIRLDNPNLIETELFLINQPSIDIGKALNKEFKKRDDIILELEKKIKTLEDVKGD